MLCVTCIHIYPNQLFLNDTYKIAHTNAGIKTIHTHIHTQLNTEKKETTVEDSKKIYNIMDVKCEKIIQRNIKIL